MESPLSAGSKSPFDGPGVNSYMQSSAVSYTFSKTQISQKYSFSRRME